MACKVKLYFYDLNSGKNIFDEGCKLKVNDDDVNIGTFETEESILKFSLSTAIPGNGGYEFKKWGFSQNGASFAPTNTETLVQDVTDVPYLEVRCCLMPKTGEQQAKIVYNPNNGQELIEQKVMFNDHKTRLIDAPSCTYLYTDPDTGNTKEVIKVFAGWSTSETVVGADSITDEYTPGVAYEKYKKFWKSDYNGVKVYYQVTEEMLSAKDPTRPDVLANTSWDDVKDYMFRLGANGAITYAALANYTPRALRIEMEAVWRSPAEDGSLYPQGEIIYEDEDGNVIGRETAFSGVDVKAGDDGDFKGIAFDEWEDESGKKIKKSSTIKTPSGGDDGWSMHFHVSAEVKRVCWVRYDTKGGLPLIEPQAVEPGETITIAGLPEKKGNKALSWRGEGGYYEEGALFTVNTDVTFSACYSTSQGHKVTFDPCGAYSVNPKTKDVEDGEMYGSLPTPTPIGTPLPEIFSGWYTSRFGGQKIVATSKVLRPSDHTLFAHWDKLKTIIVHPNGGEVRDTEGNWSSSEIRIYSYPGTFVGPAVKREGYNIEADFAGYFTSSSMSAKTKYNPAAKENNNTNPVRVYAKWAQKVTFDTNGGEPATITDKHGFFAGKTYSEVGFPDESSFEKEDSEFEAWYTEKEGGDKITNASIVSNQIERILYAHWAATIQKVTFDPNGGTDVCMAGDKENKGGILNPPIVKFSTAQKYAKLPYARYFGTQVVEIKTFDGWYTAATGGEEVTTESIVSQESTRTLYAHYLDKKKVTFHAKGGNFGPTGYDGLLYSITRYFIVTRGEKTETYGELPIPKRDGGWEFDGWFTSSKGGDEITEDSEVKNSTDLTLYAHWTRKTDVAILTYDYNGGIESVANKVVYKEDMAGALPLPVNKDWSLQFNGWHQQVSAFAASKRDGGEVSGSLVTSKTIVEGDMMVKAAWSKKIFLYYAIAPQGN